MADIYQLGQDLLAAVVDHFTDETIDLPERRYVTIGAPAIDCEQVVVSVSQFFSGLPGAAYVGPLVPGVTSSVEFAVSVVRCVATPDDRGNPPTVEDLATDAQALLADADTLRAAMFIAKKDGVFDNCNDIVIAETTAVGPEGGFGGWSQLIRVGL